MSFPFRHGHCIYLQTVYIALHCIMLYLGFIFSCVTMKEKDIEANNRYKIVHRKTKLIKHLTSFKN